MISERNALFPKFYPTHFLNRKQKDACCWIVLVLLVECRVEYRKNKPLYPQSYDVPGQADMHQQIDAQIDAF